MKRRVDPVRYEGTWLQLRGERNREKNKEFEEWCKDNGVPVLVMIITGEVPGNDYNYVQFKNELTEKEKSFICLRWGA